MNPLTVVSKLDAWLESMRGPDGYTGPVSHWWESSFLYTGPLYDWRYEGIIDGYRELYLRTKDSLYLERALLAAADLEPQLTADGRFLNSSFQFGPVRGGTPHEAALDVALLKLAQTLRAESLGGDARLLELASCNIERYWLGTLWNGVGFKDQPYNPVLVPNKHGTMLEALLAYASLTGKNVETYVRACVKVITEAQVKVGTQAGGVVHLGIGRSKLAIPIYTSRAMNGLLAYHDATGDERVRETVVLAARFVTRLFGSRGVAWGVYGNGQHCYNPQMIAGAGDVLRFLSRAHARGFVDAADSTAQLSALIMAQQQPSGALPTAHGFVRKGRLGETARSEFRDVLPVVGWVDKSFRALSALVPFGSRLAPAETAAYKREVVWRGRACVFEEDARSFRLTRDGEPLYVWCKGRRYANVYKL